MCHTIAEQLILCFSKADIAGRRVLEQIVERKIDHVSYNESLEGGLAKIGLKEGPGKMSASDLLHRASQRNSPLLFPLRMFLPVRRTNILFAILFDPPVARSLLTTSFKQS